MGCKVGCWPIDERWNLICEPQAKLHKLSFELDLVCFIFFDCLSSMLYELWWEKISIIYDIALEKNGCERNCSQ